MGPDRLKVGPEDMSAVVVVVVIGGGTYPWRGTP